MAEAFICDAVRTPVGRYSGALSAVRADDLAESMSRAPFVIPKADTAFSRTNSIFDTTIGWRFVNPKMKRDWGVDSMPETADNVAVKFNVSRADKTPLQPAARPVGPKPRKPGGSRRRSFR